MANSSLSRNRTTGQTIYFTVRDREAQVWDTAGGPAAFVVFAPADWGDYDIAYTETPPGSAWYVGTFPSGISAGRYYVDTYIQAGGSPVQGDTLEDTMVIDWDGASIMDADSILTRAISGVESTADDVSLATMILSTVNKANTTDNAGFLTVYETDGISEHVQIPISTTGDADPIDGVG